MNQARLCQFSFVALLWTAPLIPGAAESLGAMAQKPDPNAAAVPGISKNVVPPSETFKSYEEHGQFRLTVPDNWEDFRKGPVTTFAPKGAYANQQGQAVFTHGVIAGAKDTTATDLTAILDEQVAEVLQSRAYLQPDKKADKVTLGGQAGLRKQLTGTSPITNRKEIVDVFAALMYQGRLFYMVQVVPSNDQPKYRTAFEEMVRSVRLLAKK